MRARRAAWFGVSLVAVASWFSAASTPDVRPPSVRLTEPDGPSALDRSAAALQSEVTRLHERLGPTATPARSRDLFRFSTRKPVRPVRLDTPAAAVAPVEPAPVEPAPRLQLIGVAEDPSPDGVVRTAIVSGLGDVFLVKPGETIAGQFRVEQVSADAVQLISTTTAASITLALR
jgi:hypothetical protein